MSEISELYEAYREVRKDKKIANIESSLKLLRSHAVGYQVLNGCNHHTLVAGQFDFWPSTGKWRDRKSGKRGRGVWDLIKSIREAR